MKLIKSNKYVKRLTAGLGACILSASLMHVDSYAFNVYKSVGYAINSNSASESPISDGVNGGDISELEKNSDNNIYEVISNWISCGYASKDDILNTYLPYIILTKEIDFSDMGYIAVDMIKNGLVSFNDLSKIVLNVSRYNENDKLYNLVGDSKLYKFKLEDLSKMIIPISNSINLTYDDYNNFFIGLNPYYYDYDYSMYSDKEEDYFYVTIGNSRYSVTDDDREKIKNNLFYYKFLNDTGISDYERALDNFIVFDFICGMVSAECGSAKTYDEALAIVSTMLNRLDSTRWENHNNGDLIAKLADPDQYEVYVIDAYCQVGFSQYINNSAPNEIRKAVSDCLYHGIRNNYFCKFRAKDSAGDNVYFISQYGNMYLDMMDGIVIGDNGITDYRDNRFTHPNSAQTLSSFRK